MVRQLCTKRAHLQVFACVQGRQSTSAAAKIPVGTEASPVLSKPQFCISYFLGELVTARKKRTSTKSHSSYHAKALPQLQAGDLHGRRRL